MNTIISLEKILSGYARKSELWLRLTNCDNYKKILPFINDIKIHEKGNSFFIIEWFIILDGVPFRWMEKNKVYDDKYTVKFEAISGDFEIFQGEWKIEDYKDADDISCIRISYLLEYKLGIPVIEESCGDLLKERIYNYIERFITALCDPIENNSKNQRTFERISLNTKCLLSIDNIVSEMNIVNISKKGMLLHYREEVSTTPLDREIEINFAGISLRGCIYFEPLSYNCRIIFKEPLNDIDFNNILNIITNKINETSQLLRIYDVVMSPVKEIRNVRNTISLRE